jgi:two-component system sensor histidine kinase YesM
MSAVEKGEYVAIKGDDSRDEIGKIIHIYNTMVNSLHDLIHENYLVNLNIQNIELKKKEAEIMVLQSQIDPHFLFNTLESIRMSLVRKGDTEDANAVLAMSRLLKATYSFRHDKITIREEIDFVEDYIRIQKFKFRDKIAFRINVQESCFEYWIPKLTIQPIIENAIQHGFSKTRKEGAINLEIKETDQQVVIQIDDNGVGMDPELLQEITQEMNRHEDLRTDRFVGLRNINERIQLYYGPQYGVRINSQKGKGTRVFIQIPVDLKKAE